MSQNRERNPVNEEDLTKKEQVRSEATELFAQFAYAGVFHVLRRAFNPSACLSEIHKLAAEVIGDRTGVIKHIEELVAKGAVATATELALILNDDGLMC